MKVKVIFLVDYEKINFFAGFFNLEQNKRQYEDSEKHLQCIKNLWNEKRAKINKLICHLFYGYPGVILIKVYVFPKYFRLGASETAKKIVLYGQPPRSKLFPLAIILHEIIHILIKKMNITRPVILDEIICMMAEDYILSLEDKTLNDIWRQFELDTFHKNAFKMATKLKDKLILNKDIGSLIKILEDDLPTRLVKSKPRKGLLDNLN